MAIFQQGAFTLDPNDTPDSIRKKRAMIQQLIMPYGKASNIGEGVAQLFNGIGTGMQNRALDKAESAGQAFGATARENIASMITGNTSAPLGQGAFPDAPKQTSSPAPMVGAMEGGRVSDRLSMAGYSGDKTRMLADALMGNVRGGKGWTEVVGPDGVTIRREGARNWRNNNPGNIEFGPFAKSAGAIGSDGRFAVFPSYEAGRSAKAKLLFESPSYNTKTISGAISRYAPQFENDTGGYISAVASAIGVPASTPISALTPQQRETMLDAMQKVEGFKVGREVRNGRPIEGVQVASNDPSFGMQSAYAPTPKPSGAMDALNSVAQSQPMYTGQVNANGTISTAAQPQQPQPAPQPQQIAQAASQAPQGQTLDAGTPFERQGQPQGIDLNTLMQHSQNPWLDDQSRAFVNGLIQQEMQKRDPAYQMQQQQAQIGLQKSQLELQQLQNPQPRLENVGGRLVQINPDGTVKEAYAPPPEPVKEPAKPAEIQEYEYAKGQGFPGTFQDWKASQKGGMALQVDPSTGAVTFQQGGNIKPMTEAQSKDTVYATRAEGALPILDQYANELTGVIGNTVGQLPLVGNAMKPEGFQKAEQASGEFLQAILRKDTGAAITADEQRLYGDTYLPRMGDGPDVLEQKRIARTRALEALKSGMTPQAILAQEKALAKVPQAAPTGEKKRLKFNPATGELE